MNAIEVKQLRKTFGKGWRNHGHDALRSFDLAIRQGTFFGLIGPNGAGKTTFVKTLLAVVRPTAGSVKVFGRSPEEPSIRARIGYLPERLHFAPGTTAQSFLMTVARFRGIKGAANEVRSQLGRVGLSPEAGRRVSSFSKGMRQRLGLAGALLGQPDLLILDEPTDGIDPIGRAEIRRMLQNECGRGATVLMNSHLLSETERSCDTIGILVKGRLVREGQIDALCRDESRWLLRFEQHQVDETLLHLGLTKTSDPNEWIAEVSDVEALNRILAKAQNAGALLVGLKPYGRSLEEILADAVGGVSS